MSNEQRGVDANVWNAITVRNGENTDIEISWSWFEAARRYIHVYKRSHYVGTEKSVKEQDLVKTFSETYNE